MSLRVSPGIYFKHGSYYRVSKGIWHRLGRTLEDAQRHPGWAGAQHVDAIALRFAALRVRRAAKMNAKHGRRPIPFELTEEDVETLLVRAGWRCAVTGVDFSLEKIAGKRPYGPSIDRIDCSKGYTLDNCRLVCMAANIAMNVWGPEVLQKMAESMVRKVSKDAKCPIEADPESVKNERDRAYEDSAPLSATNDLSA